MLASKMSKKFPYIQFNIFAKENIGLAQSDIICTVTSSKYPVVFGDHVSAGTHINAVGASVPTDQEIDIGLLSKAKIFVDYKPSILAQAKEIITALDKQLIKDSSELTEIGNVIGKVNNGRLNKDEITIYRSMGIAAQDIAVASYVLEEAHKNNIGIEGSIV